MRFFNKKGGRQNKNEQNQKQHIQTKTEDITDISDYRIGPTKIVEHVSRTGKDRIIKIVYEARSVKKKKRNT